MPSSTLMRRKGAWRRRNRKQFPFYTTLNTIVLSFYILPERKERKKETLGKRKSRQREDVENELTRNVTIRDAN